MKWITIHFSIILVLAVVFATAADACSVPVFRYALERWQADSYRLIVLYEKDLAEEAEKILDGIREEAESVHGASPVFIAKLDVGGKIPEELRNLLDSGGPYPRMHLLLPQFYRVNTPLWSGPVTEKNCEMILRSPARRDIARRLVKGETAVWIFIPGNDGKENEKTLRALRDALAKAEKELLLPHQLDETDTAYDSAMSEAVELKVKFSVVTVALDDPAEMVLSKTIELMAGEDPLGGKPAAIPVFGRGRALEIYVGAGINEDNVMEACAFLTGPCSCQVKALNPGLDVLMMVDWDSLVSGMIGVDEALPPLSVPVPAAAVKTPPITTDERLSGREDFLARNLMITAFLGFAALIAGTYIVLRKRNNDG